MPRRISDYPDAFSGWNAISSMGSLLSVVGTFIFTYVLYTQLHYGKNASRNNWHVFKFFTDTLR